MRRTHRYWLTLVIGLSLVAAAQARGKTAVEMLRDMFRSPVTEWKQQLSDNSGLLNNEFFDNVEKRIRWGIENNHIDDAFRFAMVGDFASEVKRRPANFRIDLADLFFKAENYLMAGQIVDNILISSPNTPPALPAKHIRGKLLEMQKQVVEAREIYRELASQGYKPGTTWYQAGQISLAIQREAEAEEEFRKAAAAGNEMARLELQRLEAINNAGFAVIAPEENVSPGATGGNNPGAVASASGGAKNLMSQARLATANGKLDDAVSLYKRVLEDEPGNLEALQELGAVYYRSGDLDKAKVTLDMGVAAHPNDVKLLRYRANTHERLFDRTGNGKDLTDAIADYRKASALAPNNQFLDWELRRATAKN